MTKTWKRPPSMYQLAMMSDGDASRAVHDWLKDAPAGITGKAAATTAMRAGRVRYLAQHPYLRSLGALVKIIRPYEGHRSPVIIHVPHDGAALPEDLRLPSITDLNSEMRLMADLRTEEIANNIAEYVWPNIVSNDLSRVVFDPERFDGDALKINWRLTWTAFLHWLPRNSKYPPMPSTKLSL